MCYGLNEVVGLLYGVKVCFQIWNDELYCSQVLLSLSRVQSGHCSDLSSVDYLHALQDVEDPIDVQWL